jgi:hypothetical protein
MVVVKNNKSFAIVVPTNRILSSWLSYAENFRIFNHSPDEVILIAVDDYSPYVNENIKILEKAGTPYEYWTVDMQIEFFKKEFGSNWEKYWEIIPHRTDACRSFGYIIAALKDVDIIITYDDDNWALSLPDSNFDYIGCHDIVNSYYKGIEVSSTNGWFNTISMLMTVPQNKIYARGYPYSKRGSDQYTYRPSEGKVLLNVGLWAGNPDVDAITVLNEGSMNGLPITRTTGLKNYSKILLSKDTFAPLNTANTAYSIELIPIMYDTFQGAYVGELKLDRFGDIWCNLFIEKILNYMDGRITIGTPIVEHRREPRNTLEDFKKEFWGILISEKLFIAIEQAELNSKGYVNLYQELIEWLQKSFLKQLNEIPSLKKYFDKLFTSMMRWVELVEKLRLL